MSPLDYIDRPLFGGAITIRTPGNLIDASNIRQVPDTQEVFMYPDSGTSIIVEILQRVQPSQLDEAIRFHFDSLAHDNDAESTLVHNVQTLPNDSGNEMPPITLLSGRQKVQKFNREVRDSVEILMALYRIEDKGIDLVVTFNIPVESVDEGAVEAEMIPLTLAHFDTLVRSLRILDYNLFA